MKKSILLVAVIAASFTSCKKDHACTCTGTKVTTTITTLPGQPSKTTVTSTDNAGVITFTKARKGDAKSACLSSKKSDEGTGLFSTWTSEDTKECTLK